MVDLGAIPAKRLCLESIKIPIVRNRFTYPTRCMSVHECLSAVGSSLLANIRVHQRLKKQPYARSCPLYPPALSPPAKALGEKEGQAGGAGVRLQDSGETAKQPYALDGTFRGWWLILVRSMHSDRVRNQQRFQSCATASRTLRAALAFISVYQRSAFLH